MRFFRPKLATAMALCLPFSYSAFVLGPSFVVKHSSRTDTTTPLFLNEKDACVEPFDDDDVSGTGDLDSRRTFLSSVVSSAAGLSMAAMSLPDIAMADTKKVLVLGGSGFVGSEVCKKLQSLGVDVVATSRDGRDGTVALDVTSSDINVATEVEKLAKDCSAVISCIGSIGTPNDGVVNAASGLAAAGAKAAGVKRFVYISNAPEVREVTKGISFLDDYMTGKAFSEDSIKSYFGGGSLSYTIIGPTFIYGGNKFGLNPPRVASGYGKLIEGLLSSGPFRAAAGVAPGFIGVALEPPVSVSSVAGACVAGAMGLSEPILDTYDEINDAAKKLA